jgi:hypothetical protein
MASILLRMSLLALFSIGIVGMAAWDLSRMEVSNFTTMEMHIRRQYRNIGFASHKNNNRCK